jgi:hypothetical protein
VLGDSKHITVDLIVHRRGCNKHNLICIEMKKSINGRKIKGIDKDKDRLCIMTSRNSNFAYRIWFMIIAYINTKKLDIEDTFYLKNLSI